MTETPVTQAGEPPSHVEQPGEHSSHLEEYVGGYIKAWVGHIPLWLLAVYAVLFVWGLYYSYTYWGGLGPGRID